MAVVKSDSAKASKTSKAPAKSKKPVTVAAAKILRVQDFAERHNIAKSIVLKLIEDAKIEVVFSQPSGRGFINLYSVEQVEPILKKHLEEKAAADAERLRLENEKAARKQKKTDSKGQQELPLQIAGTVFDPVVLDPIKSQIGDLNSLLHRHQDTNSKQFELLSTQMKMLEQQLTGIYQLVSSLETAFLSVHTAPSAPPETPSPAPSPEPVKTEEANKGQEFFQKGDAANEVTAKPTTPKTLRLSKKKATAGEVSTSTSNAGGAVGPLVGKAAGTNTNGSKDSRDKSARPRVLIIGLHDNKVRHFNDFQNIMDLTIINPDNATMMSTKTFPSADYTLFMVDFVAHSACTQAAQGSEEILVRGSNTKLRHTLANIALKHNLQ